MRTRVSTVVIMRILFTTIFVTMILLPLGTVSPSLPIPDSKDYTAVPIWSSKSVACKLLTGEFDVAHAGLELAAVCADGSVILIEGSEFVWNPVTICAVTGRATAVAMGNIDNSSAEDEIFVGTEEGSLWYIHKSNGIWSCDMVGGNSEYLWGAITGISVAHIEDGVENSVVVAGTSGKVLELIPGKGSWTGRSLYLSCFPIIGLVFVDIYPLNPGKELVVISGETDNSVLMVTPYTGPNILSWSEWGAVRIWNSPVPLCSIHAGRLDPFSTSDELLVVSGDELDTGPFYHANEIEYSNGKWTGSEIFNANAPLSVAVGDFNRTHGGAEIAIAAGSAGVYLVFRGELDRNWDSAKIWDSPDELYDISASDFSSDWAGSELAVADSVNSVTLLSEMRPVWPEIAFETPQGSSTVRGKSVDISWAGGNCNGRASVDIYYSLTGDSGPWCIIGQDLPEKGSVPWMVPEGNGSVWLATVLQDTLGMTASDSVMFFRERDTSAPAIVHLPVKAAYHGEPLAITATVRDDDAVKYVNIYYREYGKADFKSEPLYSISLVSSSTYTATIPASQVIGTALEYYITAVDKSDNVAIAPDTAPDTPYTVCLVDRKNPAALDRVEITPSQATLTVGDEVQFQAETYDTDSISVSATIVWKTDSRIGSIDDTGLFHAMAAGTGYVEVTATYNGTTGTCRAPVSVNSVILEIRGRVQDSTGKPIVSARVSAIATDSSWHGSAISDRIGAFRIIGVMQGRTYTVTAEKTGYETEKRAGVGPGGTIIITLKATPSPPAPSIIPKDTIPTAVLFSVIAATVSMVGMFGDILKYKFFCMLVPLYSKIEKDRVLDNFVRGQVYGHIKTNPGTHYSKIRRVLGIKNGSLAYHLRTLEKSEFIVARTDGKFKRFYPRGMKIPDPCGVTLSDPQVKIVDVVRNNPGISQSMISRLLNFRKQSVNYHVKQLVKTEIIRVVEFGRETRCYAGEA